MRPLLATTAAILTAAFYALSCWLWPYADCRKCDGAGHHRPSGKRRRLSRPCRRCKSTGKRLRVGRRVANAWHRHRT